MNKKYTIWGRSFDLNIVFDCFPDEKPTQMQLDSLEEFNRNCASLFKESEWNVWQYCKKCATISDDGNIFKYVVPQYLYVQRNKHDRVVGLMCAYKFDPEHNLTVVFRNGNFDNIGHHDIIL